jgi:hypothetical protein
MEMKLMGDALLLLWLLRPILLLLLPLQQQ